MMIRTSLAWFEEIADFFPYNEELPGHPVVKIDQSYYDKLSQDKLTEEEKRLIHLQYSHWKHRHHPPTPKPHPEPKPLTVEIQSVHPVSVNLISASPGIQFQNGIGEFVDLCRLLDDAD